MKKFFSFFLSATIIGCTAGKEVQMSFADVQLVKIDTVKRYPYLNEKLLTWQENNRVNYVTFVPVEAHYALGTHMRVMMRR
jgi:hypothetical protein